MKKIAAFIVKRRYIMLGIVAVLALLGILLAMHVEINYDMTKYLANDSSMKIGMDIMEEEFGDTEDSQTIRVMAQGLSEAEKQELLEKLASLPYVSSVDYDSSEDYNTGDYTLFIINTDYAYSSSEEKSIEKSLSSDFGDYNIIWQNDDDTMVLEPWIVVVAVALLLVVMLVMCESWIEPFLFLIAVGMAVLINSGTNLILGSVSSITCSVAAILQLVLSMDYSIILMNRYRQEKALCADKESAMVRALTHAFSSITSSSLTTVVGLLALVFMSFKIGRDLGIVLAKGVFISLICIIVALPGMILACDKLIEKTAKKSLNPSMKWMAKFSYRFRYGLLAAFLVMFVGFYFAHQLTDTAYTLEEADEIAEIFPDESTLVLIYENQDEDAAAALAESLEANESVTQVLGYPNLLGKKYTASGLLDAVDDLSTTFGIETDMDIDDTMLDLMYYTYYDGSVEELDMSSFLTFLSDDVMENESFADMIDDEMASQSEKLELFADAEELTRSMTIEELADFFDMEDDTVQSLLLYYYTQHGGAETGSMTLQTFVDYVVDEVSQDPDYSDLFDEDTLDGLEQLQTYTDKDTVTSGLSYTDMASTLDMDSDTVRLLYVYYFANQGGYTPGTMTLHAFTTFVLQNVLTDATFSSYFDSSTAAQLATLSLYTDTNAITSQYTAGELASLLGMDESLVEIVYTLYAAGDISGRTMTLSDFTSFLTAGVLENSLLSGAVDETQLTQLTVLSNLIQIAASGQELSAGELAALLGMDQSVVEQLLLMYAMDQISDEEVAAETMTVMEFAAFLAEDVLTDETYASQFSEETAAQIQNLYMFLQAGTSGQEFTAAELAGLTGMEESMVSQMLMVAASGEPQDTDGSAGTTAGSGEIAGNVETDETEASNDDAGISEIVSDTKNTEVDTAAEAADSADTAADETDELADAASDEVMAAAVVSSADATKNYIVIAGEEADIIEAVDDAAAEDLITQDTVQEAGDVGTVATYTMTLPDFLTLILENYAAYLDEESLTQLTQMQQILGLAQSGQEMNITALAQVFGMETAQGEQLMRLYMAQGEQSVSLPAFTAYLTGSVMQDETYATYFDESSSAQLIQMNQLIQMAAGGTSLTAAAMAQAMWMDEETAALVYQLYYGQGNAATMSLTEFIDYLLDDMTQNAMMASYFDSDTISGLVQARTLMQSALSGTAYTYSGLASLLGMDSATVKLLYTLHDGEAGKLSSWQVSLVTLVDYLLDNSGTFSSMMSDSAISQLQTASDIMHGAINGTHYTAVEIAELLGMEADQAEQLYLLYISEYGDTSTWQLSVREMVDFLAEEVLSDEDYASLLTDEERESLTGAKALVDAVLSGEAYTPAACADLLAALTDELDENTVELLYLYYASLQNYDDTWTLSLVELFSYLRDTLLDDQRFSQWIDEDMRSEILDMSDSLDEGTDMLKSEDWSRLIITSTLPDESEETKAFFDDLTAWLDENFQGEYHLIGNAAMVYEMQASFDGEMTFITILTAVAIFIVVTLTFRSLAAPVILVFLVQCGVYIAITALGIFGSGVYYLAMLIVDCILMGTTIDYAILLTNYYREFRTSMPVRHALESAYKGSIHTIMTSGLILILVPGALSYCFQEMTIRQICRAISIGAICACFLILFILPGVLAAFDRFIIRKKKRYKGES